MGASESSPKGSPRGAFFMFAIKLPFCASCPKRLGADLALPRNLADKNPVMNPVLESNNGKDSGRPGAKIRERFNVLG